MLKRHLPRLVSVLLILTIAVTFAGHPAHAQGKKITFLTPPWGVPPDQDALKAWEDKSGITVEIQSVQTSDLFSRVQTAAASNIAPADVIFLTEEAPSNVIATGNMMDLTAMIAASPDLDMKDFNKVDFFTQDGKIYGIPAYQQLVMLEYNTAKLKQAGFDTAPTTWADFDTEAKAIKSKGVDQYPIAFAASDWSWYLIALSMGDPMFDKDLNPVFRTTLLSAGSQFFQIFFRFLPRGCVLELQIGFEQLIQTGLCTQRLGVIEADNLPDIREIEAFFDAMLPCGRLVFALKGVMRCIDSQSTTAHTISSHFTVNSVRAASAFTAGTDLVTAALALRLSETVHTRPSS